MIYLIKQRNTLKKSRLNLLKGINKKKTQNKRKFKKIKFKKGRVKKAGLKRIRIGEVYDMVLYRIDYPPKLTGISTKDWIYVPSLHLNFDRNYCKSYPIVTSPNVIGIFYKCP